MPLMAVCGSSRASARRRTGAHSTSRASRAAIQCAVVPVRKWPASTSCSTVRFCMDRAKEQKRGSADRSASPTASEISRSGLALKAPTTTSAPSAVGNAPTVAAAGEDKRQRETV